MKASAAKFLSIFVISTLASLPLVANAQLTSANTSLGNNTAGLDTETNLLWLHLDYTRNLSFNQVVSAQSSGGQLAGWRYATVSEWADLYNKLGFDSAATFYISSPSDQQRQAMSNAVSFLGNLSATNDPKDAFQGGLVGDSINPGAHRYFYWSYDDCLVGCGTPNQVSSYGQFFPPQNIFDIADTQASFGGSFLVQTSPVPAPSAALLFLSGLLFIAARRSRSQ